MSISIVARQMGISHRSAKLLFIYLSVLFSDIVLSDSDICDINIECIIGTSENEKKVTSGCQCLNNTAQRNYKHVGRSNK